MTDPPGEPTGSAEAAIARDVVEVRGRYDLGTAAVEVLINERFVVVVLDDLELTRSELALAAAGLEAGVFEARRTFAAEIAWEMEAAIEAATGRRIAGSLSSFSLDPSFGVEVFRFLPA